MTRGEAVTIGALLVGAIWAICFIGHLNGESQYSRGWTDGADYADSLNTEARAFADSLRAETFEEYLAALHRMGAAALEAKERAYHEGFTAGLALADSCWRAKLGRAGA